MNHKPATPLPWVDHAPDMPRNILRDDLAYARHAANAYPRSIRCHQRALAALRANGAPNCETAKEIIALLRELGEEA